LAQRALTALVLLAAFLAALFWLPRLAFAVLTTALVGLAAREWARLCGMSRSAGRYYTGALVCAFGLLYGLAWPASWPPPPWLAAVFTAGTLFWVLLAPAWIAAGVTSGRPRLLALAGSMVLLPAALALVTLPPPLVLGVLALVWIADSAAYFTGRALGRRKLAPRISPGKTWEGALGGLLGVEVYVIICALTIPALATRLEAGEGWLLYLAGSAVLCIVSIIGDLIESAVKRQASVKDSGTLLPGHGGVLDRIDSAVAALPVAALMAIFLVAA
jgi:phosphatidate cytidylyltransferase